MALASNQRFCYQRRSPVAVVLTIEGKEHWMLRINIVLHRPAIFEDINVNAELAVTLSFDRQSFRLFTRTIFDNARISGLIEDPVERALNRAPTGARIGPCEGSANFKRQRI